MPYPRIRISHLLNILVVFTMLGGSLLSSFATATAVSQSEQAALLSPTEAGLDAPFGLMDGIDFPEPAGDPVKDMLQQTLGEDLDSGFWNIPQVARMESLPVSQAEQPAFPEKPQAALVPQNPATALADGLPAAQGLDAFAVPEDDSLDLPDEFLDENWAERAQEMPLRTTTKAKTPLLAPVSDAAFIFPNMVSFRAEPVPAVEQTVTSIYLPLVANDAEMGTPVPVPSDKIIVTPEDGGVLISTDGLVRVDVPPHAYDQEFVLRYTPAQELTDGYWLLEATTMSGEAVELNRSAQLSQRLPEARSGNPLIFRYRDGDRSVSLAAYIESNQTMAFAREADAGSKFLTTPIYAFGQFTHTSLDEEENPDEGDDGLVVTGYCWEPGDEGEDYVLSFSSVVSATQEAGVRATVGFVWDEIDEDQEVYQEYGRIFDNPESPRTDYTQEPDSITLGMTELNGENSDLGAPIPFFTVLTSTVYVNEWNTNRYDTLELDAYFTPGTVACTSGCEGVPPTIAGINLTQIGQGIMPGIGIGFLEIFAADNSGEFSISVRANGVEYPAEATDRGTFAARIEYNINGENSYEIFVTDGCGNAINFPPITSWGANSISLGSHACGPDPCGNTWMGMAGDPVNTQNGNYFDSVNDLWVSGVGGANISLDRDYNSMAVLWAGGATVQYTDGGDGNLNEEIVSGPSQYFGPGWTLPYAISVNHIDLAPLFDGVQVHYPDGHAATFVNEGGVYVSTSPGNFDTLTRTADGWTLLHKTSLEVEYFDTEGRLIEKQDRNGNSIFLTYDGAYLTRVENDSGRWIEFDYTADGYIQAVTAAEGRVISYTYTDGLLTGVTDGNNHATTYTHNANKQLTSITTPEGHAQMVQVYDDANRVTWQKIGRAEIVDFAYSEDGLETTTTDSYGRITTHFYNEQGQLVRTEDAAGNVELYDYNEKYQRIYYRDQEGREWFWTYDDDGNRLTEDGPLGWHREWDYNDQNRVTRQLTQISADQVRETRFTYDEKGNLTGVQNAMSAVSSITYDERGLPINVFDFNQNETVNTYDPVTGDLIKTENGAGDVVTYGYDGLGRMVEMVNGRFFTYTYAYDNADNLTDINGPLGYHIGYRYDANDNLRLEIDPNGGETEYWYDESEMVVRVEDQLDHPTVFVYDDMNNLIHLVDAEDREWSYEYDELYRQTAVHGPEDTHTLFEYDAVGNLTSMTECNSAYEGETCTVNRTTTYRFNALDQLVQVVTNAVNVAAETVDAAESADTNVTTTFSYDLVGNLLVLTDALGNETYYDYDLLDRLIREEDAENQVTEYAYDANGNLIRLQNPRGYVTTFTYDGANRLETMTDADDQTWAYAYDGNGNLVDETDPLGVVTHYTYDELDRVSELVQNFVPSAESSSDQNVTTGFAYDLAGNVRFVTDPRGEYVTEHQYDAAHRRTLTIDNEGGETAYGYDKVNNLVSVIDGNNHETTFVYDGLDRQFQVTNPEGHAVRFTYDRLGNTLTITDARLNTTSFTYDGMDRVVLMVDALVGEWRYTYDAIGNLLCEEDANGHANNCYTYDDVYRVLSITDAEGHTDSFTYDENGNRLTWTDGNDHTTTYTYDVVDRLATITNAEEETTRYEYDPLGNQTYLIEADDIVTRYDYDPLYRLATVNQNDQPGQPESTDVNVDTHYIYDEVGNLLTIIDAELHETTFAYDGMNRNVYEIDADGNEWEYGYDAVGNRLWRIDANGYRTDYTYYPDNQLETTSYALDGTTVTYAYDENNNQVQMVDHLGTTTWTYDALNRVTEVNDALGRVLGYGYDAVGNRTRLTYNDGRTVRYSYYDNNWLEAVTDPEGNVTSYERDGVGLMVETTNPNDTVTTATYDRVNRMLTLVNAQISGAQKVNSAFAYTYNEIGHRTEMVAEYAWRNPAVVTSTYTYDGLRRLIRDEDSEGVWTEYTFDRVGNRLVLNTNDDSLSPRPFDEKTVYYSYSDANRLLSLVGNTHPGSPATKRQDNVAQTLYAFRHEVTAQRGIHISEFAADNLLFMVNDLIDSLEGNPAPSEADVAAAIEAIRVQVVSDATGGAIYNDGVANSLLAKLRYGDSANGQGANAEWQTQTFTYDPNGNRINTEYPGPQGPRVQGTDYTYDPENRLIVHWDYQMNLQGNKVDRAITTMVYDGGGRRLVKAYDPNAGGGGEKRVEYVFDGWDPVAEYQMLNGQYENFYRGDMNRIITMHHFPSGTHGQMYWYHYDGLGSVTGLTKQLGQSHHNYRYEPYGQIEMPPGNFTDPHNHYTFTGQEWDENMGLYEFYARDYDPVTGIWLSQDIYRGELQFPSSLHRYQYVYNNPTNLMDFYGYWGATITLGGGGSAGTGVGGGLTGGGGLDFEFPSWNPLDWEVGYTVGPEGTVTYGPHVEGGVEATLSIYIWEPTEVGFDAVTICQGGGIDGKWGLGGGGSLSGCSGEGQTGSKLNLSLMAGGGGGGYGQTSISKGWGKRWSLRGTHIGNNIQEACDNIQESIPDTTEEEIDFICDFQRSFGYPCSSPY